MTTVFWWWDDGTQSLGASGPLVAFEDPGDPSIVGLRGTRLGKASKSRRRDRLARDRIR
jgi:hypothetical protein